MGKFFLYFLIFISVIVMSPNCVASADTMDIANLKESEQSDEIKKELYRYLIDNGWFNRAIEEIILIEHNEDENIFMLDNGFGAIIQCTFDAGKYEFEFLGNADEAGYKYEKNGNSYKAAYNKSFEEAVEEQGVAKDYGYTQGTSQAKPDIDWVVLSVIISVGFIICLAGFKFRKNFE